jgi:RNA polymerase sigma-70 factor (ECF subfamily)
VLDAVSMPATRPLSVSTTDMADLDRPAASRDSARAPAPRPSDAAGASAWIAMVFDQLGSRVQGMILAATRDADVAAEVTQEAFERLLREAQADRYPDAAGAWLYRTAMNLAISRIRRAAVAQRLVPRLTLRDEPLMPEGIVIGRERWRAIGEALAQLPSTERMALVMAGQSMSGGEIAAHLGKTHGATRSLMSRARGRLRRLLDGQDRPSAPSSELAPPAAPRGGVAGQMCRLSARRHS